MSSFKLQVWKEKQKNSTDSQPKLPKPNHTEQALCSTVSTLLVESASELHIHSKSLTLGATSTFQMIFHRDGVTKDELRDDLGFKERDDNNAR